MKIKFKKGDMNSLLKRLSLNKFNNFNDKTNFLMEEQEIFESISEISDLYPNA